MLLFAANWILATWAGEWDLVLEWLTLPYMACCFGRGALPVVGQIGDLGRPAYGMFLYAFPIQQVIVARAPEAEHPILLCLPSPSRRACSRGTSSRPPRCARRGGGHSPAQLRRAS